MTNPKYTTKIESIPEIGKNEQKSLKPVVEKFKFRTNDYYLSLIDWSNPDDPIRRIVIPHTGELQEWGKLDASNENKYIVLPGMEHKYEFTAMMLVSSVCGGYCRFCFRKRIFRDGNNEITHNISQAIIYIRKRRAISNVLITGGDPLILSSEKLEFILRQLRDIKHVQIIRIGTKIPAFNPFRIINDPSLLDIIKKYSTDEKKIYIMAHFNHPRELTKQAIKSMNFLQKAGAVTVNQTPIIKGVNDNPQTLARLFNKLSFIGVIPYYLFQCRPTLGNKQYVVPLEEAFTIFEQAKTSCSGLGKQARFVMSHFTGKIEVMGLTPDKIIMRYHRAANKKDKGKLMIFKRNPDTFWFDDYKELIGEYKYH